MPGCFIGAFIWLYADTVNKTSLSSQIAGLQILATEEGKQMVLSVTLSDGNNVKYLIKLPQADKLVAAAIGAPAPKEKVSSWEIERLGTALSTGDNTLPLGGRLRNEKKVAVFFLILRNLDCFSASGRSVPTVQRDGISPTVGFFGPVFPAVRQDHGGDFVLA